MTNVNVNLTFEDNYDVFVKWWHENNKLAVLCNFERAEDTKMLKWIKVRQNAPVMSASTTSASRAYHQQMKDNETRIEAKVKIKEEGEDSGMEKEDSVCNVELSDLRLLTVTFRVCSCLLTSFLLIKNSV